MKKDAVSRAKDSREKGRGVMEPKKPMMGKKEAMKKMVKDVRGQAKRAPKV